MTAIESCRTASLGGHIDQCDACGHQRISYNSCRNRHCPKCQGKARADWLDARQAELLPVPYFHVVFTIPDPLLAPLALQNKRVLYDILFRAASQTLLTIAKDAKHLGAQIGFFAVLHTWGRNLLHHPHLHCAVPAGGLSPDRQRWIACKQKFLLPVRVLSQLFRRLFLEDLQAAFEKGHLCFHGSLSDLADPSAFARLLEDARRKEWVVYAKPPFGGPECVLRYLARYVNRIALSNDRILDIENGKVSFLLEGLPRPTSAKVDDDAGRPRVHTPIPAPCRSRPGSSASATSVCSPTATVKKTSISIADSWVPPRTPSRPFRSPHPRKLQTQRSTHPRTRSVRNAGRATCGKSRPFLRSPAI